MVFDDGRVFLQKLDQIDNYVDEEEDNKDNWSNQTSPSADRLIFGDRYEGKEI